MDSLLQNDKEVYDIIQNEFQRQWACIYTPGQGGRVRSQRRAHLMGRSDIQTQIVHKTEHHSPRQDLICTYSVHITIRGT